MLDSPGTSVLAGGMHSCVFAFLSALFVALPQWLKVEEHGLNYLDAVTVQ